MNISENKIKAYLKLGRILACFVNTGLYFESKTFNWIKLEKIGSDYLATYIQSFNEGNEYLNDITNLQTVHQIDEFEKVSFSGPLDEIKKWLRDNYNISIEEFNYIKYLNEKYSELIRSNIPG